MLSDTISVKRAPHGLIIEGTITCLGGIYIEVDKTVRTFEDDGETMAVRDEYTYNVVLQGQGNIFRYDGPHPVHHQFHHVHRYDVLDGDREGAIERIEEEDDTPTLGQVVDEAEQWYYDHLSELDAQ